MRFLLLFFILKMKNVPFDRLLLCGIRGTKKEMCVMRKLILRAAALFLALPLVLCGMMCAPVVSAAASGTAILGLRTDYAENPVGIDSAAPVFSWRMESEIAGILQTGYRVVVCRDAPDGAVVWDSGMITDGRSANIAYAGEALLAQTAYYWTAEVWDNQGGRTRSEPARFETGLLSDEDWSGARWIKHSSDTGAAEDPDADRDYTFSVDFQIVRDNIGVIFSAADHRNYFMWAVNTLNAEQPYLRRHIYVDGSATGVTDIPLPKEFTASSLMNAEHRLVIRVEGETVTTSLDGVTVDSYTDPAGRLILGDFGFRVHNEAARFDNVEVLADGLETARLVADFEDGESPFDGGRIVEVDGNKKLLVDASSEYFVFEKGEAAVPADLHYSYAADFQIVRDNMGLIFAARDSRNFFMWAVNTTGAARPYLRRHIFANGSATGVTDIPLPEGFTASGLMNAEHRIEISVEGNRVTTTLDGTVVDTYEDTTGRICEGYCGFRFYNEAARFDNVRVTKTVDGQQTISLEAGFDDGISPFDGGEIVDVAGDKKLLVSSSSEYKVLESRISAATAFRKEFSTGEKTVASARVYASALGVSDLWINGQRVGTPDGNERIYDELKPGWTDYDDTVFYLAYDVTDLIRPGANAVGAEVASGWYNGVIAVRGGSFYSGQPNGLLLKLEICYTDGSSDVVVTDNTWQTSRDTAVTYADIYNGEIYDARKDAISDWSAAGFAASDWQTARYKTDYTGRVIAAIGTRVQARPELSRTPVEIIRYTGVRDNGSTYGEIDGVTHPTFPLTLNPGETLILDMGQNMVGWERFMVEGPAGAALHIQFGEMRNDSGEESRKNDGPKGSVYNANYLEAKASGQYILKGTAGGETYQPRFTFYGFRYVELTATKTITLLDLDGVVVGNANAESSSFETGDASVNQLYSNIVWGMRDNFLSTATDCPQRNERLGWTADTHIFSRTATYSADVAGFYRKWLQDMRDSQFGEEAGNLEGAYPDVAPNTHIVGGGNGGWAEAGIIVPYNVWLMYGDVQLIEEHFASMETFMDYLARHSAENPEGGWKYNGGGAASGDWVSPELNDDSVKRYISVAYYAYSAKLMTEMSAAVGRTAEQQKYAALFEDIKSEFNARYVNADGSLKVATQTTYLLALKLDLYADETLREKGLTILLQKIRDNGNRLSTGFIGTSILNQTLSEVGADDMAYTLLLQHDYPSWLYSVDQGATTIWENWDSYTLENGFKDPGMNSFNHYAYGAVGEWLYRYVAGIEADAESPGFKHFILQPTPDTRAAADIPEDQTRLTWARATYGSIYGEISSGWTLDDDLRITYTATVPANTTATLYLPLREDTDRILLNGTAFTSDDTAKLTGTRDGCAVIELGSGSYRFQVLDKDAYIPVDNISGLPETILAGRTVALAGVVSPAEAGKTEIAWTLSDAGTTGAVLEDDRLTVAAVGTVELTATVADGISPGRAFVKTFRIAVLLPGDLDRDGKVTVSDVVALRKLIVQGEYDPAGDLDDSDGLTVSDVVALRAAIVSG